MADAPKVDSEGRGIKRPASVYTNTNAFPRAEGRVLHVGTTDGEIANRVIVVGHINRAKMIAEFLEPEEPGKPVFELTSDRGFTTYTGMFQGVRISVAAVGMGVAMIDFFIREAKHTIRGPMAVVRFGTCGVLKSEVPVGTVSLASKGALMVQQNFDAFAGGAEQDHEKGDNAYLISKMCPPDAELDEMVYKALKEELGESQIFRGLNVTADSFYGSQGRQDPNFADDNTELFPHLQKKYPDALSMEMESFMVLHMARRCRPDGHVRAASAAVNVANRGTGDICSAEQLKAAERNGGKALLKALAELKV